LRSACQMLIWGFWCGPLLLKRHNYV
jgi:hypothetical protein